MLDKATSIIKAMQLRKRLGEDCNSPIDIFVMAQNIDSLTLVYYPMGDNLSGMCIKGESGNCVIAINSAMSLGRQRFSLGHEFYHMYYDEKMFSLCSKKIGDGKDIEKEADMFASYFLMPAAELENMVVLLADKHADKKLILDDVIKIEQYFGMSHQATVIRLKESKYMKRNQCESFLMSRVRSRAETLGFSSELYYPLPEKKQYKTLGHYINQAGTLYQRGIISDGKYEELLLTAFRSDLVYGGEEDGDVLD